ncbi:MAG: hypothetical protein U0531_11125 [Dehalococcoidia bacterium]
MPRPAPEVVSHGIIAKVTNPRRLPKPARRGLMLAQHLGFGALGGALFTLLLPAVRPRPLWGALTGLAIWTGSYGGWIPALSIMPPPERDDPGRVRTMVAAHIVYGLTLGALVDRWSGDR